MSSPRECCQAVRPAGGSKRRDDRVRLGPPMLVTLCCALLQIAVPPPRGYVNDFAGVLDAASVVHMTAVITELREKTRGEIAVVTLADIGDRPAADVALQIGRQWGVGAKAEAGDPAKNLGVVVLLVPLKNHRPGTGQLFVATGRGAEGFLTEARVGGRGVGGGGGAGGLGGGSVGWGGVGGSSGGGAGGRF